MPNEIPTPAPETPTPPLPPPAAPSNVPPPPPAASLVVAGTVTSERELALQRELETERTGRRAAEFLASEKEREVQELKKIPAAPAVKPAKVKRTPGWSDPVFSDDDETENGGVNE